jgi:hypothetical protein
MKERQHLQKALGGQIESDDTLAPGANISTIVRCSNYPHYQAILDQVITLATLSLTNCSLTAFVAFEQHFIHLFSHELCCPMGFAVLYMYFTALFVLLLSLLSSNSSTY